MLSTEDEPVPPTYERFFAEARNRYVQGRETYGDSSYHAHPLKLIAELRQEILDIPNYAHFLYERLAAIERKIVALQQAMTDAAKTNA